MEELPSSVIVSTGAAGAVSAVSVITSAIPMPPSPPQHVLLENSASPSSPTRVDTRPARRGRKRAAPPRSADPRTSPRVKRYTRKSEVEALTDAKLLDVESRLQPEASETECSRVVSEPLDKVVKTEGVVDSRLGFESVACNQENLKPVEMLMDPVKVEASLLPVKEECHAPSSMDLLAIEAMRELSKPPILCDVKPDPVPLLNLPEVKLEATEEVKVLSAPEPKPEDSREEKAAPIRRKV